MSNVELLELDKLSDGLWQLARKPVEAEVEDGKAGELSNARIQATGEITVEKNDLIEGGAHTADASRHAAGKLVISEDENGYRRTAERRRNIRRETIVVHKNGVELFGKEIGRQSTFKFVETEVQIFERRHRENNNRKFSYQPVIAQI